MITKEMLYRAHKLSEDNRKQLTDNRDQLCGCYHCGAIFSGLEIDPLALSSSRSVPCVFCGIDSLIVEDFGVPITAEFLEAMNAEYFAERKQRMTFGPSGFLSCFDALTRCDQRGVMNAVARQGCHLCKNRTQCPHATGKIPQSNFVCDFAVDIQCFAEVLKEGVKAVIE